MVIVAAQSTPLAKLKEQHTFLKTSEILKIPKTFHNLKSYKSQEYPDTNLDPNPEDPDNNDPEDPDCAVMCKETSMGFPFCDCQHDVPLRINQDLDCISCQPTDDCWDECQEICEEICEEGGHFEFCDCNHTPTDTPPKELLKIADNGDNLKPEEPNCTNICKETSEGFPFCDCQHTPPLKLVTLEFAKFIKTVDSNDTEPAEPNCTEICKETSEGFPFCDCQHTPPLKLVTLEFGIKNAKEKNGTDPEEPDCDELCKTTSDGFPFCDCGGSHGNLKEQDDADCDGICFLENCDGFPMCDCNCVGQCGCLPTSETLQETIKVSNGTDPQDPNCTAICKETSEGFPFCDCNNNVPLKIQKNLIQKPEIKSVDDNNADLYDCEVICKGTSDGFPMCDCGLSPPVRLIQNNKKRIFPKKRILPIQLFKNQKSPPFAHYYP